MEKQQAKFYLLHISQQNIEEGFLIKASSAASKFKLLLFESTPEGTWELLAQVLPASHPATSELRG